MTTESPMRMVDSAGPRKWPSSKDAPTFAIPLNNMAAEELGLLMKSHKLDRDREETVPNRSGSAPPSMEGSLAAIGTLLAKHNPSVNASLGDFSSGNCESEEQLCAGPEYFAYYRSQVNLNPRLPPPLISRENRHLARHIGGFGNNLKFVSFDDSGNDLTDLSRGLISTHKEESEDDRSPPQGSIAGLHKSLVDLIQENFPRTPSPVDSISYSSSHATTEEPVDINLNAISLNEPSENTVRLSEPKSASTDVSPMDSTSFSKLQYHDGLGKLLPPQKDERDSNSTKLLNDLKGIPTPTNAVIESIPRGNKASHLPVSDITIQEHKSLYERSMRQNQPNQQGGVMNVVHGMGAQPVPQEMHSSYWGQDKVPHGRPAFSSVEVHPPLHSPGLAPPLYATTAAYMTSGNQYFPNLQPSNLFNPQYSVGGYGLNSSFYPPYVTDFPSHGTVPMSFDATSGQRVPHVGGTDDPNKFYGQHGLILQHSYVDPPRMHYFQNSYEGVYGAVGQYGQLASRGAFGDQGNSFDSKGSSPYMDYRNFPHSAHGNLGIPSPRRAGIVSNNYNGGAPSMGFMNQFPGSPLASPVLHRSPVASPNYSPRRDEMRFPQDSVRQRGLHNAWQGHRGGTVSHELKKHSFLEELKSTNSQKFELSDIAGRIVEFSVDQHGSRFIQQKLESCTVEEKESVFSEVLPHASKLMVDVFGNYVIQKFFEHGSSEQRKELADKLSGQILPLSLQMYGCRVIQKALEVIELDKKIQLVHELDGNVLMFVHDQNGNHVIQKCIECVPTNKIGFIISSFRGKVASLSTHPYGCRVIQRILEHCSDEVNCQCIVDEILESACVLAQDQYGNYVTQHVLERGKPRERSQIISKLTGRIVQMSQHKFASNVVEKCLEYGDASERDLIIEEIIGPNDENDNLLTMMKDQFANFVVQKILEASNDAQRKILLARIRANLQALRKYTYGKHIVARFERLTGEETEASEPLPA